MINLLRAQCIDSYNIVVYLPAKFKLFNCEKSIFVF